MTLDEAIVAVNTLRTVVREAEKAYHDAKGAEDLARIRFWAVSRMLTELDESRSQVASSRQRSK